jgi:hypothetical protein
MSEAMSSRSENVRYRRPTTPDVQIGDASSKKAMPINICQAARVGSAAALDLLASCS